MKRIFNTLFSLIALSLTVTTLSSCLDSDDDNNSNKYIQLTPSDVITVKQAISGSYTGKAFYYDSNNKLDSVEVSWTSVAADSSLTVEFPVKALAKYVHDNTTSQILAACPNKAVRLQYTVPTITYSEYWLEKYYQGTIITKDITSQIKTEDGKNITLYFADMIQMNNGYGMPVTYYPLWEYSNSEMALNLLMNKVTVDGRTFTFSQGVFSFFGKKRW